MELWIHITSASRHREATYRLLGQRPASKWHLPPEKPGYSNFFAKCSPAKKFVQPKGSISVKNDLDRGTKPKSKGSYRRISGKRPSKIWNAVSSVDCRNCFKKAKNKRFYSRRNKLKKVLAKISRHAIHLTGLPPTSAWPLAFLSWL